MDQNASRLSDAVCELELQTEVQSFMSSQPPKFTSTFEDTEIYGYMLRSVIYQVYFLCRSFPIHCLREFC